MSNDIWDSRCRRCGRCCYEKIEHDGRVFYTETPCDYLDLETRECLIFSERHKLKPECMPLTPETIGRGILPQDCPYVADINNYNAPKLSDED